MMDNDISCRLGQEGYRSCEDCPCARCSEACDAYEDWFFDSCQQESQPVEAPVFEVVSLTPAEVALELLADRLSGHRTAYAAA